MECSIRRCVAFLIFGVMTLLFVQPVVGQQKMRLAPFPDWATYEEDEEIQLELVEIKVAGKPIIFGEPFDADDNWLKSITLRVKNISNKTIVALGIGGGLLETIGEQSPPHAARQHGIGWVWGKVFDPEKEQPTGPFFNPGEILELNYKDLDKYSVQALPKAGEKGFCQLDLIPPGLQYSDGTGAQSTAQMKLPGNGKP